jgi:hypothetical protein
VRKNVLTVEMSALEDHNLGDFCDTDSHFLFLSGVWGGGVGGFTYRSFIATVNVMKSIGRLCVSRRGFVLIFTERHKEEKNSFENNVRK